MTSRLVRERCWVQFGPSSGVSSLLLADTGEGQCHETLLLPLRQNDLVWLLKDKFQKAPKLAQYLSEMATWSAVLRKKKDFSASADR